MHYYSVTRSNDKTDRAFNNDVDKNNHRKNQKLEKSSICGGSCLLFPTDVSTWSILMRRLARVVIIGVLELIQGTTLNSSDNSLLQSPSGSGRVT